MPEEEAVPEFGAVVDPEGACVVAGTETEELAGLEVELALDGSA